MFNILPSFSGTIYMIQLTHCLTELRNIFSLIIYLDISLFSRVTYVALKLEITKLGHTDRCLLTKANIEACLSFLRTDYTT